MLFSYWYTRKTKNFSTPQCLESSIIKNHILNIYLKINDALMTVIIQHFGYLFSTVKWNIINLKVNPLKSNMIIG